MILSFKTHHNGQSTNFVEKIWRGFVIHGLEESAEYKSYFEECEKRELLDSPFWPPAKLHTIREDKHDRWKPGTMIDFFINARRKNMFRFAPRIPVVSVQKIQIAYENANPMDLDCVFVYVDGKLIYRRFSNGQAVGVFNKMSQLATNDGFWSIDDFFAWFNKDFKGKIIHWTDLKY